MKQNFFLFSTLAAGLMITAACNDEQLPANSANESAEMITVSSTARISQGNPSTKLNLEEKYKEKIVEITWREDKDNPETFSVLRGEDNVNTNLFTFSQMDASSENHTASFTGDIFPDQNATYYAVYPALSETKASIHSIPVDLSRQTGELMENKVYMYAESPLGESNALDFNFQHLTSIIKVKMLFPADGSSNATVSPTTRGVAANATLKNVTLSSVEKFITKGTVDALTGEATAKYSSRSNISISSATLENYAGSVYFHLLPDTYSGLTVSAKIGDITYVAYLSDKKEIMPGIMYEATAEMEEETVIYVDNLTADAISDSYNLKVTGTLTEDAITIIKKWGWQENRGLLDLSGATFPNNEISTQAFGGCKFTEVILPDGLGTIGESAFCAAYIQSISIPESVTTIGKQAFLNCTLTNIVIPESVTSIGAYAFHGAAIQSITIPAGVTTIEEAVFNNGSCLKEITILGDIEAVGNSAFNYIPTLTDIYYRGNTVPQLGTNVFSYTVCKFHVNTEDIKSAFMEDESWKALVDAGTLEIVVGN